MLEVPRIPATNAGRRNIPLPTEILTTFTATSKTPISRFKPSFDTIGIRLRFWGN